MRGRVGTTIDIGRLSAAVSRPGIDPRVWCSLAEAVGESVVDPEYGEFVDVQLLPTGEQFTARVPAPYAGDGFGLHAGRIHAHDELVVLVPLGDPAEGAVVVARLWNAADKPAQQTVDTPDEIQLLAESDNNVRVRAAGAGGLFLESTEAVRIGAEDATEQLVLGTTFRQKQATLDTDAQTQLGNISTASAAISAAATALAGAGGTPAAVVAFAGVLGTQTTAIATAAAALSAALSTFEASASSYLSTVSKTT